MYNLKKLIVCMAGAAFALNLHAQQVYSFVLNQLLFFFYLLSSYQAIRSNGLCMAYRPTSIG